MPALNQKGDDLRPADGQNVATLQRMKVYNNFLYLQLHNSYVPGALGRIMNNTHFSPYSVGILDNYKAFFIYLRPKSHQRHNICPPHQK